MESRLGPLIVQRCTGEERIHAAGRPLGPTLLDFWRWSASDLVSNTARGVLAEFLVATALGIPPDGVRDEWGPYDLETPDGITVEVKSAAFVQSWSQTDLSSILFQVPKTRAWDAQTGVMATVPRRQARVYVFALLAHKCKGTIDPLNVQQWCFYVVPTAVLDARTRSQHSITLPSLEALVREEKAFRVPYEGLSDAVAEAARMVPETDDAGPSGYGSEASEAGTTVMTAQPAGTPDERISDLPRILHEMNQAVREALLRHKQMGNPVAVWRDGQVQWIPPEDIPVDFEDTPANSEEAPNDGR